MILVKAQRDCLDCIKTGFVVHSGERVFDLNLTTAVGMKVDLSDAFIELTRRIRLLTPLKLVKSRHIYDYEVSRFYPDLSLKDKLSFEYVAVKTSEGISGVLHVLYVGNFLPRRWVKENWHDITGSAYIIGIGEVKNKDEIAKYVSYQSKIVDYVAGQSKFVSFSYSRNWAFPNYRKIYDNFCSNFWKSELSYLAVGMDGCFGKNPFHLYKRVYNYLSYEDKREFYRKRWCEWLKYVKSCCI